MEFTPDYNNILDVAKNKKPKRIPLYEHIISLETMEEIQGQEISNLYSEGKKGKEEFYKRYCDFFKDTGYDTVSFEKCITEVLPGGGALGRHVDPAIKTEEDFKKYPFGQIKEMYFKAFTEDFEMIREQLPKGMKLIGGVGNGVFEIAQDLMGFTNLSLLSYDNPRMYEEYFATIGNMMLEIWEEFIAKYKDDYAVLRFGDDLGFKSQTLLPAKDIIRHVIPQYRKITDLVHKNNKKFLLHSCGNIFEVMDEMIKEANIDAKHSNEDVIATFDVWVEKYSDRIGLFGGIDVDVICLKEEAEIQKYVRNILELAKSKDAGIGIGSGNSIPGYVPAQGYLAMVNTVREFRGDFK